MYKKEIQDILKVEGVKAQGFGTIGKIAMKDRRLPIESKAIYSYLSSYCGGGSTAFPSRDIICADLGISPKRYYKFFEPLRKFGYVLVKQTISSGNRFANNVYTLPDHPVSEPCSQIDHTENEEPCGQFAYTQDDHINNNSININTTTPATATQTGDKICLDGTVLQAFELWEKEKGQKISPLLEIQIKKILEMSNITLFTEAVKEAVMNDKLTLSYIRKILDRYKKAGITNKEDVDLDRQKFGERKTKRIQKRTEKKVIRSGKYDILYL